MMTMARSIDAVRRFRVKTCLLAAALFFCLLSIDGISADPPEYVRQADWSETLQAFQAKYARWWQAEVQGVQLELWHTTERAEAHQLQEPIDLEATDKEDNRHWQVRPELPDGIVHCDLSNHGIHQQRRLPGEEVPTEVLEGIDAHSSPANLLLVREIEAPRAMRITARIGADFGIEVWLNGSRLFSDVALGNGLQPEPDQAEVDLPLTAGKNQLVLRLLDVRRSGFYFSTVAGDPSGEYLADRMLNALEEDFPMPTRRMLGDISKQEVITWLRNRDDVDLLTRLTEKAALQLGSHNQDLREQLLGVSRDLRLYDEASHLRKAWADLEMIDFAATRHAIDDLRQTYPDRYTHADEYLQAVDRYERQLPGIQEGLERREDAAIDLVADLVAMHRKVLLENPLLDFDRLLLIQRETLGDPRRAEAPNRGMGEFLGLPQQSSWQLDRIRQPYGWKNEIRVLSDLRGARRLETLFRPPTPRLVSDIDLHFDGERLLFSMPGSYHHWQVFELDVDGRGLRQVSQGDQKDVHNFDGCYLPNEKIVFVSTAALQGVPCSNGIAVAMNYRMDADGRNVTQLCFDQDHDYCPTVMNDGRVLYLRWDYTDLPHQWPRILFTMNPDGTGQREFYGSNSYWPNAIFYARPVPDHPTMVAGIVTGHHVGRVGELVLFDPARGRHEADGVVQRIPGHGQKVEPVIMDKLTIDSWPKFVHPYPLSEKYFLVAGKPRPNDLWGIYLVDVFDNLVLLKEVEGYGMFEPVPLRSRARPPEIPERVIPQLDEAIVYLEDVYRGPGLRGVPRGTVKQLRLFAYTFAFPYMSGGQHRVGTDGPWEPKRVLGTVPVEADGSAIFRVPAKTPISIQAIDAEGQAVQLMRSWTTAMPGEIVSCVGCHERQNDAPPSQATIAATRPPSRIEPSFGPVHGFSFPRDVQPVLNKYCTACHDGTKSATGQDIPDLRGDRDTYVVFGDREPRPKWIQGTAKEQLVQEYAGVFEPAYFELRRLVRVGGLESDLHVLQPGEFHANTAELVQTLRKGHHGVKLDRDAWQRLTTWIDLNAPCHGSWQEILGLERTREDHARRQELRRLYASIDDDPEVIPEFLAMNTGPVVPEPVARSVQEPIECAEWPLNAAEAVDRQRKAGDATTRFLDLGDGVRMELNLVPAGEFVMGDSQGLPDETPLARVRIGEPFWIGQFEVTNEQYAQFDSTHDSRHEHGTASFNSLEATGPLLNQPRQPVVRISWEEAMAFCDWLSETSELSVTLPTEAQWEYACRAGTATPFSYGGLDADFSPWANVADATISTWATYNEKRRSADQVPRDDRFDDHSLVTADVGSYRSNAWGLHDMHGNVWEWTRSTYRSYPYQDNDGRNATDAGSARVVRGGSWYDRPKRCRSAFRLDYPIWQKVYNVGFRVVCQAKVSERSP